MSSFEFAYAITVSFCEANAAAQGRKPTDEEYRAALSEAFDAAIKIEADRMKLLVEQGNIRRRSERRKRLVLWAVAGAAFGLAISLAFGH